MKEFIVMEKLAKKCTEIAKTSWTEKTKSNGNFSEADKRAIGELANTMLEYCLRNIQDFVNVQIPE